MTGRATAAALLVAAMVGAAAAATDDIADAAVIAEPEAYRTEDYRAPVPATLQGARVIGTAEAETLWRDKRATFVDVLPHAPKPKNLPAGTLWREPLHRDIPGSFWLPDTGYGALAAVTETYFRDGLERATGGDHARALVFYCLRNCWMSWNAAKRALAMGFSDVIWYPDGNDGWAAAGLPLADVTPEPRGE